MGNVPVIQESATAITALAHVVTGDTEAAEQTLLDYADKSIIGSGVCAAVEACSGNMEEAERYGKGMARATASVLAVSRSIPVLHEVAVASDSLGDCMAGEPQKAAGHWSDYVDNSAVGSIGGAIDAAAKGDHERAAQLLENSQKKLQVAQVDAAVIAVTVITAGAAAPAGVLACSAITAATTATASTAATVATTAIENDGDLSNLRPGDVLGAMLNGAAAGAIAGAVGAKGYEKKVLTDVGKVCQEYHKLDLQLQATQLPENPEWAEMANRLDTMRKARNLRQKAQTMMEKRLPRLAEAKGGHVEAIANLDRGIAKLERQMAALGDRHLRRIYNPRVE